MFIVIARYCVAPAHQEAFVRESTAVYRPQLARAAGFRRLLFLRHRTDPEYLDVQTEWENEAAFLQYAARTSAQLLRTPHEVRERYLCETITE